MLSFFFSVFLFTVIVFQFTLCIVYPVIRIADKTQTIARLLLVSIALQENYRTVDVINIYFRYNIWKTINFFSVLFYTMNYDNGNDYIHVCIRTYRNSICIHISTETLLTNFNKLRYLEHLGVSKFFLSPAMFEIPKFNCISSQWQTSCCFTDITSSFPYVSFQMTLHYIMFEYISQVKICLHTAAMDSFQETYE